MTFDATEKYQSETAVPLVAFALWRVAKAPAKSQELKGDANG